jgi:hypothetical protein
MTRQKSSEYRRKLAARRKHLKELYVERHEYFEVNPEYKGWLWWKRVVGYVVYVLRVEGAAWATWSSIPSPMFCRPSSPRTVGC